MNLLHVPQKLVEKLEMQDEHGVLYLKRGVFVCCEGDLLQLEGDGAYILEKEVVKGVDQAGAELLVKRVKWP